MKPSDPLKGILFKLFSVILFAGMSALVRLLGEATPVGQIVFFRSAFAIVPVLLIYAWRGELMAAVRTRRPLGHLGRGGLSLFGMYSNFASLVRLPLADATAISFASPLITVALAVVILKERLRIYRLSAVLVGFAGVIVMLAPHLEFGTNAGKTTATIGALFAVVAVFCTAGIVIQTRRLTQSESTPSIVFYFSVICAIAGALTLPFAWYTPTWLELAGLIGLGLLGGLGHIFLTECYRYAAASAVASFDYTGMIWAIVLGYWLFGEVPTAMVLIGSAIVAAAGLFVIWRERELDRGRKLETPSAR